MIFWCFWLWEICIRSRQRKERKNRESPAVSGGSLSSGRPLFSGKFKFLGPLWLRGPAMGKSNSFAVHLCSYTWACIYDISRSCLPRILLSVPDSYFFPCAKGSWPFYSSSYIFPILFVCSTFSYFMFYGSIKWVLIVLWDGRNLRLFLFHKNLISFSLRPR